MEAKTMYAVEHYYTDDRSTYEIFETLNEDLKTFFYLHSVAKIIKTCF